MGPEAKKRYLDLLDKELESKQESLASIEYGRNTAESAMTSHHDHLRSDLAQDYSILLGVIENMKKFREFIKGAPYCSRIEEGAEFKLNLMEEGEIIQAIYSPIKVTLPGIYTITPNSPLGNAIKRLFPGDAFFYGPRDEQKTGTIEDIK